MQNDHDRISIFPTITSVQNFGIFHDSPSSPLLWRFAAEIAAIRRLYNKSIRNKHSRVADRALSRPTSEYT